jgi:hypothetical protein
MGNTIRFFLNDGGKEWDIVIIPCRLLSPRLEKQDLRNGSTIKVK